MINPSYLSIAILMFSLTACTSGRYDEPRGSSIVVANLFLNKNVKIDTNQNSLCEYALVKEQESKYQVKAVGSDYILLSETGGPTTLIPLSNICFQL